jgi:hypothetical protein
VRADPKEDLERLQKIKAAAARRTYEVTWKNYREGRRVNPETLYWWSRRWLEADRDLSDKKADQLAAYRSHWERMREWERLVRDLQRANVTTVDEVSAVEFYRAEAEIWLIKAR